MRILVCGGRDYINERRVYEVLGQYKGQATVIIHGKARGADFIAGTWALINNVTVEAYPADWKRFGKAAGPRRNKQMLDEGKPDLVIAFPGGDGTANMITQANKAGVFVVQYEDDNV
jgi:hypothetical protein